jgi:hypothetical protein
MKMWNQSQSHRMAGLRFLEVEIRASGYGIWRTETRSEHFGMMAL